MIEGLFEDIDNFLKGNKDQSSMSVFLDDTEIEQIITSFAQARGEEGFTEEELVSIIKWCENQRMGETILSLVVRGLVLIDLNADNEPVFSISEKGKETLSWS